MIINDSYDATHIIGCTSKKKNGNFLKGKSNILIVVLMLIKLIQPKGEIFDKIY